MLPFVAGAAIAGLAPAVGAAIGRALSSGDRAEAERLLRENLAEYDGLEPQEQESLISEFANIKTDPAVRRAQMDALYGLQKKAQEGGLGVEDQAKLEGALGVADQRARAARDAVTQRSAAMGRGGSGVELAALLAGNSGAASDARQASLDVAGEASRRALQAMKDSASVAGTVRGQDWDEASTRAGGMDAIAKFNSNLRQQGWENRMRYADSRNRARAGVAGYQSEQARGTQEMWGGIGQGVGQAGGTIAGAYAPRGGGVYAGGDAQVSESDGRPVDPNKNLRRKP